VVVIAAPAQTRGMEQARLTRQPQPLRIALELHRDGAYLSGVVREECGTEHPFRGWLGLLTLLDPSPRQPVKDA
jgi:hypothetical protein